MGKKMRLFPGIIGSLAAVAVYAAINIYIARRIYQWLTLVFPGVNLIVFVVAYSLVTVTMIMGFVPAPSVIRRVIDWVSAYWMGMFVYLFLFFLTADIIVLTGRLARILPGPLQRDVLFFRGLAAIVLTIAVVSFGVYNANQIRFASYDIVLEDRTLSDELKIVLISDLHIGSLNAERNLESIIQGINNLSPDIVCIAGDIFNNSISTLSDSGRVMSLLKSIETVHGVYASMGNHDGGRKFDEIVEFLGESGVRLLADECVEIDGRLLLVGRVDRSPIGGLGNIKRKDISDVLPPCGAGMPVVVIDHNPSGIGGYSGYADLILAGHTHKGQMFPMNLITRAMYEVQYGHYQRDESSPHVVVTSGTGTWGPPIRIGSNNEIVSINLK